MLRVADNGAGIDAALLPRLFQPFMQADRTLARSGGGLGLGLVLVKGLVELHGGTVTARSEGTGRGAEFVVRLPVARDAADRCARGAPAASVAGAQRRVLVIDDDRDVAEALCAALAVGGHVIEVAHSGPMGVAKARTFMPDVVLCDIGLPGMDGYEVARVVPRGHGAARDPPGGAVRLRPVSRRGQGARRRLRRPPGETAQHRQGAGDPDAARAALTAHAGGAVSRPVRSAATAPAAAAKMRPTLAGAKNSGGDSVPALTRQN